jgi:hypothetical protein
MSAGSLILITIFVVFLRDTGFSQESGYSSTDPRERLEEYINHASTHKLHLHVNKSKYFAGESVWFSAYLFDAVTHLPDTSKTNVYVDLISSEGVLMETRLLLSENGIAAGDIHLPLTIPDGNYKLRAYTDLMKNFEESFYFTRYLYINNLQYANRISLSEIRFNRRFNRNLQNLGEEMSVVFFPEGGQMITGVINRIAFKAVDGRGRGLNAAGVVIDDSGRELVHFKTRHDGMGSFDLQPQTGIRYRAKVEFNGSRSEIFDLPNSREDGIALRVDRNGGEIVVALSSGLSSGDPGYKGNFMLLAHTRGQVVFSEMISLEDGKALINVQEGLFPAGISHFTVFDHANLPVAERLVFNPGTNKLIFMPRVFRIDHGHQDYIAMQISAADNEGVPVEAWFSIAVVNGGFKEQARSAGMLSNMLLTSDLRGLIHDPQHYFDLSGERETDLDHLMMTHGWRRFKWDPVLSGELPELSHQTASSIIIKGRVTDPAKDEPVSRHPVHLNILGGYDDEYKTTTNNKGEFIFDDLYYADAFRIEISGRRLAGDHPPDIELKSIQTHDYDYTPNAYTIEEKITSRGSEWERVAGSGRSPYDAGSEKAGTIISYGVPDQTILIDQEREIHNTLYDVLIERAHGLNLYGNQLIFRGPSSINLGSEPMYMIDGVETSADNLLRQSPRGIKRIELYRGSSAAAFGVRGGGGVIIAYTRRGGDERFRDSEEYLLSGYHTPREFYSDFIVSHNDHGPDHDPVRTVYWNSELVTDKEEGATIIFPADPGTGQMQIIIEGIRIDGGMGEGEFTIEL